jgi:hypothetical protein
MSVVTLGVEAGPADPIKRDHPQPSVARERKSPRRGTLASGRSMPLLSHVTGGRRPAARYRRAIQTRRQEASELTSHRPRHAMRPSDLIHIQQARSVHSCRTLSTVSTARENWTRVPLTHRKPRSLYVSAHCRCRACVAEFPSMGSRRGRPRRPAQSSDHGGDTPPADRIRDTARGPAGRARSRPSPHGGAYRLKIHTCRIFSALWRIEAACRLVNGALAKPDAGSARSQTTRGLATPGAVRRARRDAGSTPVAVLVRARYPRVLPG